MNTRLNRRGPARDILPLLLLSAASLLFSCDSLQPDPGPPLTDDPAKGQVAVNPRGTTVIDLKTVVPFNQSATLQIATRPRLGSLTHLGSGLVQYTRDTSDVASSDSFVFIVSSASSGEKKDTVFLVPADTASIPEGLFPVEDVVRGLVPDSSFLVDVLANDVLRGYRPGDIAVVIKTGDGLPPHFGSAWMEGNNVRYRAAGSARADKVVYQASVKNAPGVSATGLVHLTPDRPCDVVVLNDSIVTNTTFAELPVDALYNDTLCAAAGARSVEVVTAPEFGTVAFTSGLFVYKPRAATYRGFSDDFEYRVCVEDQCQTGKVYIVVGD